MRQGISRWIAVVCAGVLVLAGCGSNAVTDGFDGGSFLFVSPGGQTDFSYPVGARQTIGDFAGTSVTDETALRLSNYPNTVLVLNFWGSWCGECRNEAADLNVVDALSRGRRVQFLGVNVQDDRQSAADFMVGKHVQFPSIYDPTMRTLLSLRGFPTSVIPATIVLDRRHQVAHVFLGAIGAQQLDRVVAAVAAEP